MEQAFLPFGTPFPGRSNLIAPNAYGYAQKERDKETGFNYFEARYLADSIARFLSCDPVVSTATADRLGAPQSLNAYAYAANNPLIRKDSYGLDPKERSWSDNLSDFASGAWGYASEKVSNTANYVVENPGKTTVAVVTAPAWAGWAMVYGVGSTVYNATENLVEAATGDDFDSGGYKKLDESERWKKAGRGTAQTVEVVADIAGAKALDPGDVTPKVPKKNYGPDAHAKTHVDAPPAHAKTHSDGPLAHAPTKAAPKPKAMSPAAAKAHANNMKKAKWISDEMTKSAENLSRFVREGGDPVIAFQRHADALKKIFKSADDRFGPTVIPFD